MLADAPQRTEENRIVRYCAASLMNDGRVAPLSTLIRNNAAAPLALLPCSVFPPSRDLSAALYVSTRVDSKIAPFLQIGTPEKCPSRPRRHDCWRTSCPGTTTASSWALKRGPGGVPSRGTPGCSARRGTKVCGMQVHQADDRPGITLHSSACCVVCGDCATVDWEVGNESVVPGGLPARTK